MTGVQTCALPIFLTNNKSFIKGISTEQIKKDIDEKFFIYLTKFLDFQIAYFSNLKNIMDIESVFIFILCALNTLGSKEFKKEKPLSIKNLFYRVHHSNAGNGLNATSISEITKIPRTTVLRKISNLEKVGMIKKDKFKRYAPDVLSVGKESKKLLPATGYTLELLGIFFSKFVFSCAFCVHIPFLVLSVQRTYISSACSTWGQLDGCGGR